MKTHAGTIHKEVTTIEKESPDQIVSTTTPSRVYEKKKTIFRFNQIIWYILGLVEVLLGFRVLLKALGANPFVGFTSLIYSITTPLAAPFNGIFGASVTGNNVIEWSVIIAGVVYLCIAWGLAYLSELIYPITPKDVEKL